MLDNILDLDRIDMMNEDFNPFWNWSILATEVATFVADYYFSSNRFPSRIIVKDLIQISIETESLSSDTTTES
jgi:hypothetical protein